MDLAMQAKILRVLQDTRSAVGRLRWTFGTIPLEMTGLRVAPQCGSHWSYSRLLLGSGLRPVWQFGAIPYDSRRRQES
jgi:hypothetical protein